MLGDDEVLLSTSVLGGDHLGGVPVLGFTALGEGCDDEAAFHASREEVAEAPTVFGGFEAVGNVPPPSVLATDVFLGGDHFGFGAVVGLLIESK